jgi:hypothetical protein
MSNRPLLRHFPKFQYLGLTIIMSNPSRNDHNRLLDGNEGLWFENECLKTISRYQCDIRLIDDKGPLLPGTKVVLILGARAHSLFTGANTTLDENRGSPIIVNGVPCISTFTPRDALDPKDYETTKNPYAVSDEEDEAIQDEDKVGAVLVEKGRGSTAWSNYRFWVRQDTKKAIRILENNGHIPQADVSPNYIISPSSGQIIEVLTKTKGCDLYFDMETDFYSMDMRCFAFSFSNKPQDVYVVPVLDTNYKPAYSNLAGIFRALAVGLRDNCVVAHNGSSFDFPVLAYKYKIPIGKRSFDTLIAQHRIYPTIEKSLGHCMSLWTYEPYHKNEGIHGYHTGEQARQLYLYCGKDVWGMYLVKKAQLEFAKEDAGLQASIQQGMDAIRPYMITSLLGIKFDEELRKSKVKENDRKMYQYLRIMRMLCGPKIEPLISNKKCVEYFHNMLGYPVQMRTKKGGASLAKDSLYKLRLKVENPVIDFLIKYRETQKETGTLNFKVWLPTDEMKTPSQGQLI